MAKIVENKKGFRVIEISREEVLSKLAKYGSRGTCDYCNKYHSNGYYVAVLNQWMCPVCYERWMKWAERRSEDIPFEKSNFDRYCLIFGLKKWD